MNAKRLLAIMAAMAVLLMIFAACNRGGEEPAAAPTPTPAQQQETPPADDNGDDEEEEPVGSIWSQREHIEFIQFTDHDPSIREYYRHLSAQNRHLLEYFNVSIRQIQISDPIENLTLMLASRTYPCLVFPRNTDMLRAYVEAGALHELSSLFTAYAPNVVERNSRFWPVLKAFSGDAGGGGMFVFNTHQPNHVSGFAVPWLEWIVRVDILEQQGWPNIFDEDDLFDVLAQGLIDNPYTVQGFPVTAFAQPLAAGGYNGLLCATYQFAMGRNNHMFFNRGMIYDIRYSHWIDATMEHSYRNGLEFLNRLWRNDMYHRDAVTNDWDRFEEKMLRGQVLSSFFYAWPKFSWNTRMRVEFDLPYRYVPVPFMLSSQHAAGDTKIYFTPAPEIWTSAAITQNAKDLERLLAIIDWQATDEGMELVGWGEEGVHFYRCPDTGWRTPSTEHRFWLEQPESSERWQWLYSRGTNNLFGFYGGIDPNTNQNWAMGGCAVFAAEQLDPKVIYYLNVHGWNSYQEMYENNPNFDYEISAIIDFRQSAPTWGEELDRAWARIESATHAFTMRLITAESEEAFDAIFNEMQEFRNANGLLEMLEWWNVEFFEILERFGGV